MRLTDLQNYIFQCASEIYDGAICMDLFKSDNALGTDQKIELLGYAAATQKIVDDSMYWAGDFC